MYIIGIGGAWFLLSKRVTKDYSHIKLEALEDMIFYATMGVILGRVGSVVLFFIILAEFISGPLMLFKVWEGEMPFHGGLLGVVFVIWLSARKNQCTVLALTGFIAPVSCQLGY